ncbi:MAG: hypothetical protein CSA68_07095 [Rhodobacterales bacterium]|nr:MAG: hypothetical protein CSA68_07095 [Rhodobacterales bacterium]
MDWNVKRIALLFALGLFGLSGCNMTAPRQTPPPAPRPAKPAKPTAAPQSAASQQMAQHLARLQADLRVQGLLRTDGGGPDVPFYQRDLVNNFIRIAMFDEYTANNGSIVARQTESKLRRWEQPIRMKIEFGASVPLEQRSQDTRYIRDYIKRLAKLTGLSIRLSDYKPNYHVLILNEDERQAVGPRLRQLAPGISGASERTITQMAPSTMCLVFAYSQGENSSAYAKAVAVIRGEHPDLLRHSCIHEELAQGLGLANDSPQARPSIFNDDEEFGLLTYHDGLLLKILYDKRLQTGMTALKARPIVTQIAAELMGASI